MPVQFYCAFEQAFIPLLGLWLEYVPSGHVAALPYCKFRKLKDFKETVDLWGDEMEICLQLATFMQSNESAL